MGIKRMLRSLIMIFLILALFVLIVSNSRHIWKVFGYVFCENPETITVYSVYKDYKLGHINIKGTIKDTEKFYSSYTVNIKNNIMYIGLKYNNFFGFDDKTADFDIKVPCNLNEITEIYLVNSINEVRIK